jgi:hypothetical protein
MNEQTETEMKPNKRAPKLPTFREYFTETILLDQMETPAGMANLYGPRWKAIVRAFAWLFFKLALLGLVITAAVILIRNGGAK